MIGVVYCITNSANGKRYVGITTRSIGKRFSEHLKATEKNGCSALARAVRKYGRQAFSIVKIDEAETLEDLHAKESEYIESFCTLVPSGYNLSTRIDGNLVAHADTREKMSVLHKAAWKTEERRKRGISAAFEKWNSPGYRDRLVSAHIGLKYPEASNKKVSDAKKLYWLDPANKARNSEQTKKRWADPGFRSKQTAIIKAAANTPEEKERRSRTMVGFVKTPEHLEKIAASLRGRSLGIDRVLFAAARSMNGVVIRCENGKTYDSLFRASLDTGIDRKKIGRICNGSVKRPPLRFWKDSPCAT